MTDPAPRRYGRRTRGWGWISWLLLAVAIIPLVAGPIWAAAHHWVPESDDAIVAIRAHDTFSGSPPVIGMPSTLGASNTNTGASHPGPLEFWVLSVPYAISGWSPVGLLIGIALVNLAAVAAIAWLAHRHGGAALVALVAVGVSLLSWGLGSEAIRSLWNPYIVLLPFAALTAAVGALAADDHAGLPIAAATGSFVLQTHLSYVGLVGLLVAWAGALGVGMWLRARRDDPGAPEQRRVRRAWVTAGCIVFVCWLVPVAQEFTGHPANLSAVFRGLFDSGHSTTLGLSAAAVATGRVVGWPGVGLSPIATRVWPQPALSAGAIVRWAMPWLAAVIVGGWSVRRRDWRTTRMVGTAVVVLGAAFVTASRVGTPDGLVYTYYLAWLWPCAAMVWALLAVGAYRLARHSGTPDHLPRGALRGTGYGLAAALVAVGLALPRPGPPVDQVRFRRVVNELATPVTAATPRGGHVVVVAVGAIPFVSTRAGLMTVLEAHGRHTRTALGFDRKVFPMGAPHNDHGEAADVTIWVGDGTATPPLHARRLATVEALGRDDREQLAQLQRRLVRSLRLDGVQLTDRGAAEQRDHPHSARTRQIREARRDPVAALTSGALFEVAKAGLIAAPGPLDAYERYSALSWLAGPAGRITAWVSPGRPPGPVPS